MKIYVASSWRNPRQPTVIDLLRKAGHEVYDFKNPKEGECGFHWSEIDIKWQSWTPERFKEALNHRLAINGFVQDKKALDNCEICVLVLPCGRSAHLEAGYAVGQGKPTYILLSDGEPELMYKMGTILTNTDDLIHRLASTAFMERREDQK